MNSTTNTPYQELAALVEMAESYLQAQELAVSIDTAASLPNRMKNKFPSLTFQEAAPFLLSSDPRVVCVGYIGSYLVSPKEWDTIVPVMVHCLKVEKNACLATKETRPLWQLLGALHFHLYYELNDSIFSQSNALARHRAAREAIAPELTNLLRLLEARTDIDPGGECKEQINVLLQYLGVGTPNTDDYDMIAEAAVDDYHVSPRSRCGVNPRRFRAASRSRIWRRSPCRPCSIFCIFGPTRTDTNHYGPPFSTTAPAWPAPQPGQFGPPNSLSPSGRGFGCKRLAIAFIYGSM